MNEELYDSLEDIEDELEMEDYESYEEDDEEDEDAIDDMLEALMEADEGDEDDLSERRRKRRRRSRRAKSRKPVRTARGKSAYRAPTSKKFVTHPELKNALARVGKDIRRNALGIKTVNKRIAGVSSRVDGAVRVNRVQNKNIGKLNQQMKLDGALDFAASITTNADNSMELDLVSLLRGAIKSGMLGGTTGAFSSPAVVGGLAFLLKNTSLFDNILSSKTTTA